MWAGAFLSAAAHAAVIALALWGLPWLRARSEPPIPAVAVTLIRADAFAALSARKPEPEPAAVPAPEPAPAPAPELPGPTEPAPEPPPEAEPPPEPDLSPFDSAAPLGIRSEGAPVPAPPPASPRVIEPRARPTVTVRAPEAAPQGQGAARSAGADTAGYEAAVRAAIAAAQTYPDLARVRGLAGTTRLQVTVNRDGRLVNARVLRTSGFQTLDRAALDAAVQARLPAAPGDLPGMRFTFEVGVIFQLSGG
jgi:TonB family protein